MILIHLWENVKISYNTFIELSLSISGKQDLSFLLNIKIRIYHQYIHHLTSRFIYLYWKSTTMRNYLPHYSLLPFYLFIFIFISNSFIHFLFSMSLLFNSSRTPRGVNLFTHINVHSCTICIVILFMMFIALSSII